MCQKLILIVLSLVLTAGCSRSTSENNAQPQAETSATSQAAAQQQTNLPPPPPPPESSTDQQTAPKTPPAKSEPVSPTPRPGMTIEKADVGSGEKGRGYGQGYIATPVATYFAARERIMFSVTIPDALRAYKFEHDFKGPKSNEEFMTKVIKKNGIQLPTLPPGHRYIYDPKKEELQVEKPN